MNIYIDEIPDLQEDNTWVALDIELFGMESGRLHRPDNGEFACLQIAVGEDVYIITDVNIADIAMGRVENCIWVMQNAKFDLTHLRRWGDVPDVKVWDTMLMERIMFGNYYDYASLADLVRRYLDIHLDKDVRDKFEEATELTEELLEYSAKDAYYTLRVCEEQRKIADKNDFKIWKEVDFPALKAILDFKGFRVNENKWRKVAIGNEEGAQEYKDTLDLNPASPKQVKEKLNELGARVDSTSADILEALIEDNPDGQIADVANRVLKFRKRAKKSSTYGLNWLEKYVEDDGCVYSDYKVIGASTGRTSSSDPNMQNIPVRDTPVFRECFIPREGNKLIVADYSAQEPRILAYLAQDQKMIDIFNAGKDVYIETIKIMYGKEITKDDPFRQEAKAVILGAGYGLSPHGYAKKYDVSKKEAKEKLNLYFKSFPDVKTWVYKQEKKRDYVETVIGRKFHLNPYSWQSARHSRNAPIQGTAVDQLKVALGRLWEKWPRHLCEFGVVAEIHDEIVADVPEEHAETIAKFIKVTMESVAEEICPGVKFLAEPKICDTWGGGK